MPEIWAVTNTYYFTKNIKFIIYLSFGQLQVFVLFVNNKLRNISETRLVANICFITQK